MFYGTLRCKLTKHTQDCIKKKNSVQMILQSKYVDNKGLYCEFDIREWNDYKFTIMIYTYDYNGWVYVNKLYYINMAICDLKRNRNFIVNLYIHYLYNISNWFISSQSFKSQINLLVDTV